VDEHLLKSDESKEQEAKLASVILKSAFAVTNLEILPCYALLVLFKNLIVRRIAGNVCFKKLHKVSVVNWKSESSAD
jgi:hypothetical protein